ncbi:MAG: divergent PAP2 family protein [Lachnospiraceae bacterium]|nr:divergent PAP2 family protein [Lachnospiraceae bacterium]
MSFFSELFENYLFIAAAAAWLVAQIIKTALDLVITKELSLERMIGSGGMPSSHSATVSALATAALIKCGASSHEFAISAILAIIVMYDARGVRRETGNQAVVLNKMMDYFSNEHPEKDLFDENNLKELIGHTPLQVSIGAVLGVVIALILSLVY